MTNIDPYVIFRFIMIMIHTVGDESINKNFMIYLEALLSKLELTKPDVFVEFLTYFFSNNRIDDARDLFSQRHRFMSYLYHRKIPLIDVNIGCYDLLFNYLEWQERVPKQTVVKFDVSIQGWLVNAMGHLRHTQSNHELFVMCVTNVLLYYKFHKKAYLFLSEFQRSNQDNITAQLLLFKLIKSLNKGTPKRQRTDPNYYLSAIASIEEKSRQTNRDKELEAINNFSIDECNTSLDLEQYPIISDKKNVFDNLRRLDLGREEVLELSATYSNRLEAFRLIMDSLEDVSEIKRGTRWRYLQDILNQILSSKDESFIEEVRTLWQIRYYPFWQLDDFLELARDNGSPDKKVKHRKIIKNVFRTFSSAFDPVEEASIPQEGEEVLFADDYYNIDSPEVEG